MPAGELQLAKLSRPKIGGALARERLFASLDRLRDRPVVWIAAQPGAGKTTLLASYLEARRIPSIWYQVDGGDDDPASFFHYLGLAAGALKRGKRAAAPLPAFAAEHRADLPGFARHYFRALYARMGRGAALVLDNLHEVGDDRALHRALAAAFEEVPDGVGVLAASRLEPPPAYVPLVARGRVGFIDAEEIRFTLEETGEVAASRAELDAQVVKALHDASEGWAAGLTLLVERARRGETIDPRHGGEALQHVFAYLAEQLITHDFGASIETLLQLAVPPRITARMAEALTGDAGAPALLERLYRRHLFTQRRVQGAAVSYEFHALLRAYLQHKASQTWSAERRSQVRARAAWLLEAEGTPEHAVPLYREIGDWEGLARVALASAKPLVDQGRGQTLLEWLAPIPDALRDAQPWLRYWAGSARATLAPREARAELQRAHAGFVAAGDPLGRLLAASGAILTYYFDISQLQELDPWIAEVDQLLASRIPFPTPGVELQVRMALLFAYDFRKPYPILLDECARRISELLDHPIGANERMAGAAILLVHWYQRGRVEEGQALAARMQPLLDSPGLSAANRALWWMHVGWLACFAGDPAGAVKALETAQQVRAEAALSIPLLDISTLFGLAVAALLTGDCARAETCRAATERHSGAFRRMEVGAGDMLKGLIASHRGEREAALHHAERHLAVATEGGVQWQVFYALVQCAFATAQLGRRDEMADYARRARELVAGSVHERFAYQADLMEAQGALLAGDRATMRAKLASGLAASREDGAKFFLRVRAAMLSRLFAAALAEGIEVDLAREAIRELRVPPPGPDVPGWPWPIEARTLGRFELRRDGRPVEFGRKAPRKTLQLLKAIIAAGATDVPEQTLLEALWPDEEGDAASKSLGAAVLRLRALLGDADAIVQHSGTLSLARSRVWVDAWAFESSSRLDLYQGAFLPEEEGMPWPVPMRERLRARFIQQLAAEGARLERAGHYEQAIEGYLRGLDADSIVEPFYQGLMRCYTKLDRRAEAASAYRRLKQILSVTLGLPPSATTERLYRSLHLDPAGIPNP